MNKKLATLLFAIGIGATAGPAFADSCAHWCHYFQDTCKATPGNDPAICDQNFSDCMMECYG
jgi:hypothetical protein